MYIYVMRTHVELRGNWEYYGQICGKHEATHLLLTHVALFILGKYFARIYCILRISHYVHSPEWY